MNLDEKLKFYRISKDEYSMMEDLLGRPPQGVEWALFSALWSEHCSYKSSKIHLKKFYNSSERVLEAFGENAGVVDLGQGERVAFKMESHNHPSFIEPYQGAATGVGGILRDIFTMGARPVALANYLCFGEPDADRMSYLVDGVVRGIGGYGNCVGVPNVTGQTEFHPSYNGNILVNAFALGYFGKNDDVFLSKAKGPGNLLVYVGAKTGRDGVHGASMASESFDDDSEAKKPNVQIGDPFFEKCLIESCLEVMSENLVEAIQDMGAAGLTSSSFEMASKGGVGLTMHLDKVPIRDSSITPEEILLSESQERMLLVCLPEKFEKLQKVFHRWGLDASVIGEVIPERLIKLYWHNEELASIDPDLLVENAPQYDRPYSEWQGPRRADSVSASKKSVKDMLSDIRGTSRSWIYRQYDQRVGGRTESDCSGSIGIIRLPETGRPLGIVLGCRPHMMRFDSYFGGIDTVAYPALQLAAKGFEPLAMTDCLNFGNPEKPEVMSEFVAALDGMNEMAKAAKTPVISGNVSFYNETLGKNISSTPSTGLVGLREDLSQAPKDVFKAEGEELFLVRCDQLRVENLLDEKEALRGSGSIEPGKVASFAKELREFVLQEAPSTTRVVGKFGVGYALAKMSLGGLGAKVDLKEAYGDDTSSERLYEVILSMPAGSLEKLKKAFADFEVYSLGTTGGQQLVMGEEAMAVDAMIEKYQSGWKVVQN